jgi:glycine oxidase
MRVAVIGAGAAGLGVAWRLARAGVETHVFDAGAAGGGATWASAGMLTPWQYERPLALQRACEEALLLWPQYCAQLQEASGADLGFLRHGAIRIATNDIEAQTLRNRVARLQGEGVRVAVLDPMPPFLTPRASYAAHFADEGAADNRALGPALARAVQAAGGHVHEGERIVRLLTDGKKVLGVETAGRRMACNVAVLAAGAWSAAIEGVPPHATPPVVPRKGQILAADSGGRAAFDGPLCTIQGYYAVPRANGHVVVGATLEDTGFAAQTDRDAIAAMRSWLADMVAGADAWPVVEAWSGLRPGTPDDLPILGETSVQGLLMATGQFRDGILLTPWIADQISAAIMLGRAPSSLAPFALARFEGPSRP